MGLQRPDELMEKLVFAHDAVVPQRWGVYEGILTQYLPGRSLRKRKPHALTTSSMGKDDG